VGKARTHRSIGATLCLFLAAPQPLLPMLQDGGVLQLRSDTRVVEIDISVRDAQGKPVQGLRQEDFTILDNGKPRAFGIFRTYTVGTGDPAAAQPAQPDALPEALPLQPNTFTNLGVPRQPSGHSTVILLDAINGYLNNHAATGPVAGLHHGSRTLAGGRDWLSSSGIETPTPRF